MFFCKIKLLLSPPLLLLPLLLLPLQTTTSTTNAVTTTTTATTTITIDSAAYCDTTLVMQFKTRERQLRSRFSFFLF